LGSENAPDSGEAGELLQPDGLNINDINPIGLSTVKRLLSPEPGSASNKKRKVVHTHEALDLPAGPSTTTATIRPTVPPLLDHLVFGINEVVKMLERQSDQLRIRIMELGDVLAKQQAGGKGKTKDASNGAKNRELLPTAPTGNVSGNVTAPETLSTVHTDESSATAPAATSSRLSPLQYIIIPLGSINPPTLVSHIPPYAATHNTLVYQYNHMVRVARSRLSATCMKEAVGSVGEEGADVKEEEEVRVVPLGRVEEELAQMAGLRRLACIGVRVS
jgi:hypothetical protein